MNKHRNELIDSEKKTDGCQRAGAWGGLGDKGDRIKKHKLVATDQSWDVKYSIRIIVNNIVKTMYNVRWILDLTA